MDMKLAASAYVSSVGSYAFKKSRAMDCLEMFEPALSRHRAIQRMHEEKQLRRVGLKEPPFVTSCAREPVQR